MCLKWCIDKVEAASVAELIYTPQFEYDHEVKNKLQYWLSDTEKRMGAHSYVVN